MFSFNVVDGRGRRTIWLTDVFEGRGGGGGVLLEFEKFVFFIFAEIIQLL
jgi:hypothetical protein